MNSVTIIMTCYNRKNKTIDSINSLIGSNHNVHMNFIVVDDNSDDGTEEALININHNIEIIKGNGNLFWNGGMYKGIEFALSNNEQSDYYLLVNDDVRFYTNIIEKLIKVSDNKNVVVGATSDLSGNLTYGGIRFKSKRSTKYITVSPYDKNKICDTFNANCVLIPNKIIKKVGNLDLYYKHSMGDFDYGFKIKNNGYKIVSSNEYVGVCEKNTIKGTWMDPELGIVNSIKAKESIKGLPFKQWFYYLNKNYNLGTAIFYSITPYVKIMLKSIRGK